MGTRCVQWMWVALSALLVSVVAQGQMTPSVSPLAYFIDKNGVEQQTQSVNADEGVAPLSVTFRANPSGVDDYTVHYEWHFMRAPLTGGGTPETMFVRNEQDTEYTFAESGNYTIVLKTSMWAARLRDDGTEWNDTVVLDDETLTVAVSESKLEMPNAFSPNGDGFNDVYKAKEGWKSIVEFEAWILNRWGQVLFHWNNPDEGWDGTQNGRPVKDGVYFVRVKARGADGRDYDIRRDVNLLRGYTESSNNTTTTP